MVYENPDEYLDSEKEKTKKQKRWCVKKALKLAEIKGTEKKPTEMDSDDVVNAAEKFDDFIKQKNKED